MTVMTFETYCIYDGYDRIKEDHLSLVTFENYDVGYKRSQRSYMYTFSPV